MQTDPVFAALRYAHSEQYEHPGICGGSGGALHVPTAIPWPGRKQVRPLPALQRAAIP